MNETKKSFKVIISQQKKKIFNMNEKLSHFNFYSHSHLTFVTYISRVHVEVFSFSCSVSVKESAARRKAKTF